MLEKGKRSQVRSRKALKEMGSERLVKRVHEAEIQGEEDEGKITLTLQLPMTHICIKDECGERTIALSSL